MSSAHGSWSATDIATSFRHGGDAPAVGDGHACLHGHRGLDPSSRQTWARRLPQHSRRASASCAPRVRPARRLRGRHRRRRVLLRLLNGCRSGARGRRSARGAGRRPDSDPRWHSHRRANRRGTQVCRSGRSPSGADHGGGTRRSKPSSAKQRATSSTRVSPPAISESTASRISLRRSGSSNWGHEVLRVRGRFT